MSISCTVSLRYSEMLVENRQFEPTSPLFGARSRRGDPVEFCRYFSGIRKLESMGYRMACLRYFMFSRFGTVSASTAACDRQTYRERERERERHDDSIYRANIATRGKYRMFKFHETFVHVICGRGPVHL